MKVIGLTGSIGMGKSTAAQMLRRMGVPVHDSDEVVKTLLLPGSPAMPALAQHFPEAVNAKTQTVDRAKLGQIVFRDAARRKCLEGITHPLVRDSQQSFIKSHKALGQRLAVLDIPLLYETGADARLDKVIVVTCPAFLQRQRVMSRDGMTMDRFNGILASQMPDHEKRRRADYVVQTGLGRAYAMWQLKRIINDLSL